MNSTINNNNNNNHHPDTQQQHLQPKSETNNSNNKSSPRSISTHHHGTNKILNNFIKAMNTSGALRQSMINFLLAYNVRFGVALVLRIISLAMSSPKTLLDLGEILSEKHLHFREEAVRMGLFIGSFSGLYLTSKALLRDITNEELPSSPKMTSSPVLPSPPSQQQQPQPSSPTSTTTTTTTNSPLRSLSWWHPFVSGMISGLSLLFMTKDWHRTLALYMATRAAQCFYNFSKARGYFHFWGSSWAHGDSLLFGLSSSQIMYSYVMRPQALPASYYAFIRKQGPLPEVVLQAVRDNCRGKDVNVPAVLEYVQSKGGATAMKEVLPYFTDSITGALNKQPTLIPSRALHPQTPYWFVWMGYSFWNVAKQIFGVYLSLAIVPAVVMRFQHFTRQPFTVAQKSLISAIWSTIFLSSFCSWYAGTVGITRLFQERFHMRDHKFIYYLAGVVASFSILLEQKNRRSELALYAFPRAADALYSVLYDRKLIISIPQGELVLFCVSIGLIMHFHEHDRATESPMVKMLLERFLPDDVLIPNNNKVSKRIKVRVGKLEKNLSQIEFGELRSDTPGSVISEGDDEGEDDGGGGDQLVVHHQVENNGNHTSTSSPKGQQQPAGSMISLSGSSLVA
jgi:hypothetical protein